MNRRDMSYHGRERLGKLANRAGREAGDRVDGEAVETAEAVATDLAETDDLLREVADVEARLDARANERRKEVHERGEDPHTDDVLTSLREARDAAREAAEGRVEEVVDEAAEFAHRDAEVPA